MYREVDYEYYSRELLQGLPKGVFLNTRLGSIINTMTIGWGHIGLMWGRPVFTAIIRPSRYTSVLIDSSKEFTISVPSGKDLTDELLICGQRSGRDIDKFSECELTARKSNTLETYIVGDCKLHIDCKVLMKHSLRGEEFPDLLKNEFYNQGDFHTIYYAEIASAYVIE